MAQVTLMTGPQRRRRWSDAERLEILEASFAPGAVVADVSRQFEVSTSLIYKWRREVSAAQLGPSFVPAMVLGAPGADAAPRSEAAIVVHLASGARVMIGAQASSSLVGATLKALTR